MCDLPTSVRAVAERELGETPSRRRAELKNLRRLIAEEEGFNPRQDDAFLLRFLRCRKYDADRAFKVSENYNCPGKRTPVLCKVLASRHHHNKADI